MSLGLIDGGRTDEIVYTHARRRTEQTKTAVKIEKERRRTRTNTDAHDSDRSNRSFENLDIRGYIIALNAIRIYTRKPYAKTIRYGAHTDEQKKK